jgi:BMFP domain-containing protein YqiC
MTNLVERLKFNGFSGTENVLHRTRRWTVERNEAAARIEELEAALEKAENKASKYRRRWRKA